MSEPPPPLWVRVLSLLITLAFALAVMFLILRAGGEP